VPSVLLTSDTLPERLRALGWKHDLRFRGNLGAGAAVAIVGARAASQVGMDRAHALAKHLAGRGTRIISGGALGIDGAAHRGAIAGGGATTVVLGGGIDRPYPLRHRPLFEQVLATGGALVSMQPDDVYPRPGMFLTRNPLIAALADCVLVIEAETRSGSLSTALAATRLGKVVAAWPGSRGCDKLIAAGAGVVEDVRDAELAAAGAPRQAIPAPAPVLDQTAARVADAIRSGARGVDAICASTGLAVRDVLRALPSIESSFLARKQ
jgi:DNA processing protein